MARWLSVAYCELRKYVTFTACKSYKSDNMQQMKWITAITTSNQKAVSLEVVPTTLASVLVDRYNGGVVLERM